MLAVPGSHRHDCRLLLSMSWPNSARNASLAPNGTTYIAVVCGAVSDRTAVASGGRCPEVVAQAFHKATLVLGQGASSISSN